MQDKAQTEQKLYEQFLIAASQYSKFIVAYDFVTILLIIAVGLGGISEIAKNKLLGYPSLVVLWIWSCSLVANQLYANNTIELKY